MGHEVKKWRQSGDKDTVSIIQQKRFQANPLKPLILLVPEARLELARA
jgi:hypothetical protein